MRFTDSSIKALRPRSKRYDVFEHGTMGFHLRISPRGVKTFCYRYSHKGKTKRLTIGRYPAMSLKEANAIVSDSRNMILSGIDPAEAKKKEQEKERAAVTVGKLIELYIGNYAINKNKSWADIRKFLNRYVPEEWKRRKAQSIERWEVYALLEKINARGHGQTCNKLRAFLRVMFDYAVERSMIKMSPMWGIKKMHRPRPRSRFLSDDEIRNFWNDFPRLTNCTKVVELALKLMLVTGQRACEIRLMKKEHLDYENLIWTIPPENSKNGKQHRVPLSELAVDIIREAYQLHKEYIFIFNSPKNRDMELSRHSLPRVVLKYYQQALIPRFTPHDLRRTFVTHCTQLGMRRDWIKYVLNHANSDVTSIYDQYAYDKEKKTILDSWASVLIRHINSEDKPEVEKSNVINFLLTEKGE